MPITPTIVQNIGEYDRSLYQATWVLVTATPDGIPVEIPEWADRTFQAIGFAASGAVCQFEGSNDNVNWFALHNAAGALTASLNANGLMTVIELPRWMRPNLSTPGTAASVTVILLARRANPMRQ